MQVDFAIPLIILAVLLLTSVWIDRDNPYD
jgi:hypothetical protein